MTISTNTYLVEITHDELRVIEQVFDTMADINSSADKCIGSLDATVVRTEAETFKRLKEQFCSMLWGGAALHKKVNGDYRG